MKRRKNNSGTLFNRGGTWYVRIRINGKLVQKSTKTGDKEKAREVLDDYATGCDMTRHERLAAVEAALNPKRPSPTFDEAWTAYTNHPKNANQSDGARSVDLGRWRFFIAWIHGREKTRTLPAQPAAHPEITDIDGVTAEVASAFLSHAKENASPTTVNKYIRVLARVWRFAGAGANPWADFSKVPEEQHQRRALTADEVKKLIRAASGELRVLFALGAFTGLRMSDCARLEWERVDGKAKTIKLRPHKTKYSTGVWVYLPIHPYLLRVLGKPKKSGYIMPELAAWPEWKLSTAVQAHFMACGLAESVKLSTHRRRSCTVGFHSFRSTFISMMADAGAPLAMVQQLVGHVSAELTQLYYRSSLESARAVMNRLKF